MKVAVIGSGGREHALAWKLAQSKTVEKLYAIPGSAAMAEIAECIDIPVSDLEKIAVYCCGEGIDMLVVGPEVPLTEGLADGQCIIVGHNYAMSTTDIYYDEARRSLLYCVANQSTSPASFFLREVFLDGAPAVSHPLMLPEEIPNVGEREYPYMGQPNVTFLPDKILYNYPVDSHIYVMDRASGESQAFEANSNFTSNQAAPCDWKNYADCERHRVENPHFYEVRYLPDRDMYARLHVNGQAFDCWKRRGESIWSMICGSGLPIP